MKMWFIDITNTVQSSSFISNQQQNIKFYIKLCYMPHIIMASHSQLHLFCERLGTYTTITTLSCIHLTPWSLFQTPSQFCFMGTHFTVLTFHHVTLGIIYTSTPAIQWTKHHISGMNQTKTKLVWNFNNYLAVIYKSMTKISYVR